MRWHGILIAVALIASVVILTANTTVAAQETRGVVFLAEVRGVISPPVASYLVRVLEEAAAANAHLVVIQLDTPGGLDTSMREIIQSILESPVPVAVYVSPTGGRAASAGLFILLSSHIAAMSTSTATGAAHPVGLGESNDEIMTAKVTNDAAAYIRSLAIRRGRNADWAERAVRESVSVTEREAVELNIIDLVAPTLDDLLRQLDGQSIQTSTGSVLLNPSLASRRDASMTFAESLLHVMLDPNIAFTLLTIGSIGIIAELYNPGALFPGITGAICLILAFYALGNLPTNWAGVALIAMAVILLIAELNTEGTGILSIGSIVAFLLGALMLFRPFQLESPAAPSLEVSPVLIGITTVGIFGFVLFVIGRIAQTRKAPVLTGQEQFVGMIAQVHRDLQPEGRVWFQGQAWFARTRTAQTIPVGQSVRIVGLEDLKLIVEPVDPLPAPVNTVIDPAVDPADGQH